MNRDAHQCATNMLGVLLLRGRRVGLWVAPAV